MGYRGNEIIFHLFRRPQLYRHVIDGITQLPNFVVV